MKQIIGILIILLFTGPIEAKEVDVASLPKLLGSSNMGTEFYFTFIPAWELFRSELKLYISSNMRTKVLVEVPGKGYERTKYTIPNDIIEFTLSSAIGQCYRKTDREPPKPDQVWREAGVHVVADDPIICYCVLRYQYTSASFLALPVNVLGNEYIVASFADPVGSGTLQYLTSYTGITAAYDNTVVRFTMGGTDRSETASGTIPGETTVWDLDEGDVLLIGALGHHAELTGSRIVASNPVSVVSGNYCAYVPTECGCCEVLEEMEIPTYAWGKTYHITPIIDRKKNSIIKIFAKEPYTKVYRDSEFLGIIRTAGGTEGVAYFHLRADEGEPRPIVISGDKPISVTQYNTGQMDDGIESDPFQMVLLPVEQYQNDITFNTPGIRGGFGFTKNYINICYESYEGDVLPDDLEIAFYNSTDSVFNWYKLKDTLGQKGTPFNNFEFGRQYSYTTFKLPVDGVYKLRAVNPFQAYSYGFSWCDSYGHPAAVFLDSIKYNEEPSSGDEPLFNIFPNPAIEQLIIKPRIGFEAESRILIFDLIGKVLHEEYDKLSMGNEKIIDLRSFASGLYYIRITTGKEIFIENFLVIK